jgi:hypothetical protein
MSTVQSQFSFQRVTSAINAAIAAATPADGSISLAKLATQATATILGNNSGSNASPSALSASDARTLLGLATTDSPTFAGVDAVTFGSMLGGTQIRSFGLVRFAFGTTASVFELRSDGQVAWNAGTSVNQFKDLFLHRGGPGILEQRNGTNAQRLRVAKTWTSATNFEQFEIDCAGDASNFDLASIVGSAGGTARGIRIGGKNAAGTFTSWLSFATTGAATFASRLLVGGASGDFALDVAGVNGFRVTGNTGGVTIGTRSTGDSAVLYNTANLFHIYGNSANRLTLNLLNGELIAQGNLTITPSASRTLATNGQFTIERVSNTEINLVYRGDDGVTRRSLLTFV